MKLEAQAAENPRQELPSRASLLLFQVKASVLRLRRTVKNACHPIPTFSKAEVGEYGCLVAEAKSRLYAADQPEEKILEFGKVQNLRIAAQSLNGLVLGAGTEFSFWRTVGKCTRRRGYVEGRQLQEGCLMPAVGGGICQLSNALYDVAVQAGAEIVERHAHSRIIPGSAAERNRDATVAWNYIDLRFNLPVDCRLSVALSKDSLSVQLHAGQPIQPIVKESKRIPLRTLIDPVAHSCGLCGQTDCHLHDAFRGQVSASTAFIVDEISPEFEAYIASRRTASDTLLLPIDGKRWNLSRYGWSTNSYSQVGSAPIQTIVRSIRSRKLAAQGAERQLAMIADARVLATALAKQIPHTAEHVVVAQTLLPFLWDLGVLGGRTFDVLMTRLPLAEIHTQLDQASRHHPDSPTLSDFRAPDSLITSETRALRAAQRLISPHSFIACNDPRKLLLTWEPGVNQSWTKGDRIVFPGPTLGRKGAYEVREAALALDLEVVLLGADLEGTHFWVGVKTRRMMPGEAWLEGVLAVVQPATIEDKPRRLLRAIASGCPVICSLQCGLAEYPNVIHVQPNDASAIIQALKKLQGNDLSGASALQSSER